MAFALFDRLRQLRKRQRAWKHQAPFYLTLFLTNRCNLRCTHCFYSGQLDASPKSQLTLDQVEKLLVSLKNRLTSVIVTGGEPLLHQELLSICQAIDTQTVCRYIDLDTNGILTEQTLETVEKLSQQLQGHLNVQVSLDGLEDTHDRIRQAPGAFRKAQETLRQLCKLAEPRKNLTACALTTVSERNCDEIVPLHEFLSRELGVAHNLNIVRGSSFGAWGLPEEVRGPFNPADRAYGIPPTEKLEELYAALYGNKVEPETPSQRLQRWKFRTLLDLIVTRKRTLECFAGFIDGVVYPDGDVGVCEMTKPFANLRDFDWDFGKAWHSAQAEQMRKKTRACYCLHTCNLLHSMRYNWHIAKHL